MEAWMRPLATAWMCFAIAFGNLSCSVNILQTFADTKTNEALFEDAQTMVNQQDYNGALAKIALMTGAYPAQEKVVVLKASAYGGLCGFQFIPFVEAFSGMGSTLLFPFLLQTFDTTSATNMINCLAAQNTIEGLGSITQRSTDNNFFLAMIAFAKVGSILSYYADAAPQDGAGDAGFDPCVVNAGARAPGGPITDGDVREIGSGITIALANLSAVASQVNLGSGSLTSINSVCSALSGGLAAYNFCNITDPTAFDANQLKGIRSLIKESTAVGLGTNCTGDITACNCP
jgi:hypothetical protein